jgi:hypothetical protein
MACCGRRIKAAAKAAPAIKHDSTVQPVPAPEISVSVTDEPQEVIEEQKTTIRRKRMGAIKTR